MNASALTGAVALFCGGFILVASLLHLTLRDPLHLHADVRSEKLVMMERLHGPVSSAAFGTSRVHNGFDPRAFDAVLGTRSMNLGIEGGSQAEQRTMALEFTRQLKPQPGTPCLILLELTAGANFQNEHLVHPRAINIYDWSTARFIAHLSNSRMPLIQRVGRTGFALAATALHYFNIGMISNEVFTPPLDQDILADELKDNQRGLKIDPFSAHERPGIDERFRQRPAQPELTPGNLTPGNSDLIADLIAANPTRNLSFAYFTLPVTGDLALAETYPDHLTVSGRDVPILNLGRPDLFPALFQTDMFHDIGHLSKAGADAFSQTLAQQLKAWYATHGGPPPCSVSATKPGPEGTP
ncbi:hypothetical protein [Granulicella tundricola]|uniref:hypothetical protein n=1 Tax=Granulicella tundricola TaxID=940615 RepID=UPI0003098A72|nr:hypothetical protein [Granulicella tundricola]